MARDHLARQPVQIGGPPIVAEAVPFLAHPPGPRLGQMAQGREPREEARIELLDPAHLGLLQHHLRHQHAVGIAGLPPRQIASVSAEPGEEPAPEAGRERRDARGGLRGHEAPR